MEEENLILAKSGSRATITINRPNKLNAFDKPTILKMTALLNELEHDVSVRSVVITGAGDRSFCAGTDINYLSSIKTKEEADSFIDSVQEIGFIIEKMDKVVIAAINGYCMGLGNEIAMSCDIRIAIKEAKFSQPEIRLGVLPGAGGTQRLTQIIGIAKAKEMIFTGDAITAGEALSLGLVNYVVEKDGLNAKVDEIIGRINQNSFNAVKNIKRSINEGFQLKGYKLEKEMFAACFVHPDRKEGIDAFLSKRKPNFE